MKRLVPIILAVILLTSCVHNNIANIENYSTNESMFVLIEHIHQWDVVYHKETKVMYAVSSDGYGQGVFSLLVNRDGKPLLYKGN